MDQEVDQVVSEQPDWNQLFQQLLSSDKPAKRSSENSTSSEAQTVPALLEKVQAFFTARQEPQASSLDHLLGLAHSLKYYASKQMSTLQYGQFLTKVNSSAFQWLHNLLRLSADFKGNFYSSSFEARLKVFQAALNRKFPEYETAGFKAFGQYTPVILTTRTAQEWPWLTSICQQLGLPKESVVAVEDVINLDEASKPFILIMSAGGDFPYTIMDDHSVIALLKNYDVSVHLEGPLGILDQALTNHGRPLPQVHSIYFDAAIIFGNYPSSEPVPVIFYQKSAVEPNESTPLRLDLWFGFQYLGKNRVESNLRYAYDLCSQLSGSLFKTLEVEVKRNSSPFQVYWRYVPLSTHPDIHLDMLLLDPNSTLDQENPGELPKVHSSLVSDFINNVNKQILSDINHTSASELDFKLVSYVSSEGTDLYWQFNPFASTNLRSMSSDILSTFIHNLITEVQHIDLALSTRSYFMEQVAQTNGLFNVFLPNFVGLGAVRYVPDVVRFNKELLQEYQQSDVKLGSKINEEVDQINRSILAILNRPKAEGEEPSSNFHEVKDVEGRTAIAVCHDGLDPKANVAGYLQQILDAASQLETEGQFYNVLGSMVEDSIQKALDKIKVETEKEVAQVGLFRKIPLVGSVYNWWSPIKSTEKGSSFNIITNELKNPEITSPKKVGGSAPTSPQTTPMKPPRPSTPIKSLPNISVSVPVPLDVPEEVPVAAPSETEPTKETVPEKTD